MCILPGSLAITQNADSVDIVASSSLLTTDLTSASNLGAGEGLFSAEVSDDLQFRSLVAGTGVTFGTSTNAITINSSGGGASQLTDLSDVNSAGVTAGNFLIADGVDFESVALSGDATLAASGTLSIVSDAVSDAEIDYTTVTLADLTNDANFGDVTTAASLTGNWVNTANPWADNEVADTLTIGSSGSVDFGALTATGEAQGDIAYYNGTNWTRLVAGTSGQMLQTNGASSNPSWVTGGSGETNTGSNLGGGTGIFGTKVGSDLQFKSLIGGDNTTISSTTNDITIDVASSTGANLGAGEGLFASLAGNTLNFRSLIAGTGVTFGTSTNAITINSSGGGASQLTDLSDVNTATVTNRNVLVADGVDFESRALVEADISDLGSYITSISTDTLTNKTFDANGTGNSLLNVDIADFANGTDGELITWNAAGVPAIVAVGTSGQILTSNGTGAAPTFQAAGSGSGTLNTLSEADSQIGGADIATLDFGAGFDLTEPVDTKIKVDLDLSETGNVSVTGDWDFGGGGIEIENNVTVPGSCTDGQIFIDTDGASGQRLYACESGSFVLQGGGGATFYPPFGSYGAETNTTATTPSVSDTYQKVDGTGFSAGTLNDFTYSSNRLTYTGTESRHFHIVSNFDFTTANNVIIAVKWYKNGSPLGFPVRRKVGTGSDVGAVSVHADAVLATNDYLELWIKNETNTSDVLLEDVYAFVMGMQMSP